MRRLRRFRVFLACLVAAQAVVPPVHADWALFRGLTTVQKLARQIDRMEQHLDDYGTVVPKTPDVWGQARLTKFRRDYEQVMKGELENFKVTLNGALTRSDQAFLTNAMSIQAALGGAPAGGLVPSSQVVTSSQTRVVEGPLGRIIRDANGNPVRETTSSQQVVPTQEFQAQDLPSVAEDPLSPTPFQSTDLVRKQNIIGFGVGAGADQGIALEPTVQLDQMSRYLQHLNELRRINDGDDQADSPGYALHLVRIPVSVLPGTRTRQGYGAEVTITAKPHLHPELLPQTVRGLVINDLVDQFAFPMASFLDSDDSGSTLEAFEKALNAPSVPEHIKSCLVNLTKRLTVLTGLGVESWQSVKSGELITHETLGLAAALSDSLQAADPRVSALFADKIQILINQLDGAKEAYRDFISSLVDAAASPNSSEYDPALRKLVAEALLDPDFAERVRGVPESAPSKFAPDSDEFKGQLKKATGSYANLKEFRQKLNVDGISAAVQDVSQSANEILNSLSTLGGNAIAVPPVSSTPSRRAQLPIPITQVLDVYGKTGLGMVALKARGLKEDSLNQPRTLLLDMQKFMAEEFNSAYDYLEHRPELWIHATPELARAIRLKQQPTIVSMRDSFYAETDFTNPDSKQRHTFALAWAILVESALLNERLIEDMRLLASSKNAFHVSGEGLSFIGPCPDPAAREAFNQYVECRWPVHVFAVDPITQDQNIADAYSMRREVQLSLSLAMASGRIGAQNFTRMARRLELDMETIALNRTIVGFSHGDDTFGWRFLPRVQSPDTHTNIRTWAELLVCGGPNRDMLLRQHRLEPGIRECTAIVLMPSFVPYVIFDMRTNWFKLTNPARKQLPLTDGVDLSAEVTCLRQLSTQCTADAHLYRPDEVYRLTRAVEQLDRRLPLQTSYVQMPYENSLGGFEFFSTGTGDLAPELKGFYGEAGVQADPSLTTASSIFLLGDHFSVHETQVIVGNRHISGSDVELLSRQVMRVNIPANVTVEDGGVVDCHIATPYGISNHMLIPVTGQKKAETPPAGPVLFDWAKASGVVQLVLDAGRKIRTVHQQSAIAIQDKGSSPFPSDCETPTYELRAFVDVMQTGEETPFTRKRLGIPEIQLNRKSAAFEPDSGEGLLERALCDALKDVQFPEGTSALVIHAFIKALEPGHPDGQPVIQLESDLVLTVKLCEPQCVNPLPGCPACPAPQASEEPAPAPAAPQAPAPELPSNAPGPGAFLPTLPRAAAQPIGERASRSTPEWRRAVR